MAMRSLLVGVLACRRERGQGMVRRAGQESPIRRSRWVDWLLPGTPVFLAMLAGGIQGRRPPGIASSQSP
jgi:hypothetical protein